MIHTKMTENRP